MFVIIARKNYQSVNLVRADRQATNQQALYHKPAYPGKTCSAGLK